MANRVLGGLLILALSAVLGFAVSQSGDTATNYTWRGLVEQRLDRIENKLDRLIERRR